LVPPVSVGSPTATQGPNASLALNVTLAAVFAASGLVIFE
jgi:hypothetical protein